MPHRSFVLLALLPGVLSAQVALTFDQSVPVLRSGSPLPLAWAGGLNCPQISDIDVDLDGDKDLFLFDRSVDKPIFLLNTGGNYALTHAYDQVSPLPGIHHWALLRDYNCDGKEDLFTYTNGAFAVYKNTGTAAALSFKLADDEVGSNYVPTQSPNLFLTETDVPGIEDVDGDGDLDVITFSIFGSYLEYHRNLSMERYGTCDSLVYELRSRCWGAFFESSVNSGVRLGSPCTGNVPDPELPVQIAQATAELAEGGTASDRASRAHSGSTILPIDLDADLDMDLILGDLSSTHLMALTNGGRVDSAYMVAKDSLFPIYDHPADMEFFLGMYYEDVDHDGKRDLLVTPNSPGGSENARSVWFYRNTTSDDAPVFEFEQDDLFQENMLEVGEGAYPVLFDHNRDGLMDIVLANYGYYASNLNFIGRFTLLENVGTATAPAFSIVTRNYMDLDDVGIGAGMYPAFGDVDGDGDEDLYIGDALGGLHFFRNTATGPVATFELAQASVLNDAGTAIDVGQFATPQFFDVDGDSRKDLLIGERNGNINYYRNTGTSTAAVWHLESDSVGSVLVAEHGNVTGHSVPFMYLNGSGQRELLVGSEAGWIHWYDGIEGNLSGTWNEVDSTWQDLYEGTRTGVAMHDFNGDGHLDAVIGNYRGGLSYWRNDFTSDVTDRSGTAAEEVFALNPNPAAQTVDVVLSLPPTTGTRLEVFNSVGQVVRSLPLRDRRTTLDLGTLHNGVYMLRLGQGAARWTQRLVVMH